MKMSKSTASSKGEIISASKSHKCNVCGKTFPFKLVLDMHKRDHVIKDQYKCNLCSSTYSKKSQLEMHYRRHTGERPYRCDECNSTFMNTSNLHRHKRKHSTQKKYDLDEWEAALALTNNLGTNNKPLKPKSECSITEYLCNICGQMFFDSGVLLNHKKKHNKSNSDKNNSSNSEISNVDDPKSKPISMSNICRCSICGYFSASKELMKKHEQKHFEKFPNNELIVENKSSLQSDVISYNSHYITHRDYNPLHDIQGTFELAQSNTLEAVKPSIILDEQPSSLDNSQLQELHPPSHLYLSSINFDYQDQILHVPNSNLAIEPMPMQYHNLTTELDANSSIINIANNQNADNYPKDTYSSNQSLPYDLKNMNFSHDLFVDKSKSSHSDSNCNQMDYNCIRIRNDMNIKPERYLNDSSENIKQEPRE